MMRLIFSHCSAIFAGPPGGSTRKVRHPHGVEIPMHPAAFFQRISIPEFDAETESGFRVKVSRNGIAASGKSGISNNQFLVRRPPDIRANSLGERICSRPSSSANMRPGFPFRLGRFSKRIPDTSVSSRNPGAASPARVSHCMLRPFLRLRHR